MRCSLHAIFIYFAFRVVAPKASAAFYGVIVQPFTMTLEPF
jgi:hypothetical protein